jgi:hypothetical protein
LKIKEKYLKNERMARPLSIIENSQSHVKSSRKVAVAVEKVSIYAYKFDMFKLFKLLVHLKFIPFLKMCKAAHFTSVLTSSQ